jgi:hypothetical protein
MKGDARAPPSVLLCGPGRAVVLRVGRTSADVCEKMLPGFGEQVRAVSRAGVSPSF